MDHDRDVRFVVGTDVGEVEANREVVIYLHCAELPVAADDVFYDKVDLRAVERGFAEFYRVIDPEVDDGIAEGGLGLVPVFRGTDIFVTFRIAERKADAVIVHAECGEDFFYQIEAAFDFLSDLIGRAEEMGVVLGKAADAGHAAEFTGLFPAIDRAEFCEADGEVAVGMMVAREDLDVVRAVHRLE